MFGNAGRDHIEKYGSKPEHYAWIGWKNHKHSVNNPYAQFQTEYTLEEIEDGADDPRAADQAAVLPDLRRRRRGDRGLRALRRSSTTSGTQAIEIAGQAMVTDLTTTFDDDADCIKIVGYDMSKEAARRAYEEAGVGPEDVQVIELHDCFSANELITYEALGLAAEGRGPQARRRRRRPPTAAAGRWSTRRGGLISKGHPLGATGLAQCSELTWQLRGQADKRQVDGVEVALQHNIGLGGAAVVSIYRKAA